MNDYPQPVWCGRKQNFVMQYADDFMQIIVTKSNRIDEKARNEHRENVKSEILKQNKCEYEWKIKTNISKFKMILIANKPKQNIVIENTIIEYVLVSFFGLFQLNKFIINIKKLYG